MLPRGTGHCYQETNFVVTSRRNLTVTALPGGERKNRKETKVTYKGGHAVGGRSSDLA